MRAQLGYDPAASEFHHRLARLAEQYLADGNPHLDRLLGRAIHRGRKP